MRVLSVLMVAFILAGCQKAAPRAEVRIAVLGDSLVTNGGYPQGASFAAFLEQELEAMGTPAEVRTFARYGHGTFEGHSRVDEVLRFQPKLVLITLGTENFLRGVPNGVTRAHMGALLQRFQSAGVSTALVTFEAPDLFSPQFLKHQRLVLQSVANLNRTPLLVNLGEGVIGNPALTVYDHYHPTSEGAKRMAAKAAPFVIWSLAERANARTACAQGMGQSVSATTAGPVVPGVGAPIPLVTSATATAASLPKVSSTAPKKDKKNGPKEAPKP
jgi:acyl-CoA thioesterase-1